MSIIPFARIGFMILLNVTFVQMFVQVYLEIPNGEKLAEALHSKVINTICGILSFLTNSIGGSD